MHSMKANRPVSSFLTRGYNMAVRVLYKAFREGRNSAFRLHTSFLPCAVNALHKLPERTLWYLFMKKPTDRPNMIYLCSRLHSFGGRDGRQYNRPHVRPADCASGPYSPHPYR